MTFQLTGTILSLDNARQITEKFRVRDLVLKIDKWYKKEDKSYPVKFQAINAKCDELDSRSLQDALRMGLTVRVDFDISGREAADGKIWNSLNIISVIPSGTVPGGLYADEAPKEEAYDLHTPLAPVGSSRTYEEKDLPF